MTPRDLARFFVRFQAAVFFFYAVATLTYVGPYWRAARTLHASAEADAIAFSNLTAEMIRIGLYLIAALVLFAKADGVIAFFSGRPVAPPSLHIDGNGPSL